MRDDSMMVRLGDISGRLCLFVYVTRPFVGDGAGNIEVKSATGPKQQPTSNAKAKLKTPATPAPPQTQSPRKSINLKVLPPSPSPIANTISLKNHQRSSNKPTTPDKPKP